MDQPSFESINDFLLQQDNFPWPPRSTESQHSIPASHATAPISLIPLQQQPYAPAQDPSFNLPPQDFLMLNGVTAPPTSSDQLYPTTQEQQQPTRVRKKPGRKPNPATPFLRKAQNRAAQRAFRERKEQHLRELEETIQTMRKERKAMMKELNETSKEAKQYKAEACFLRSLLLTMQLTCLHNKIDIPEHGPFFTQQTISEIECTVPFAIPVYRNAIKMYEDTMGQLVADATGGAFNPRANKRDAVRWEDNVLARDEDDDNKDEEQQHDNATPNTTSGSDDDNKPSGSQQQHDDDGDTSMTMDDSGNEDSSSTSAPANKDAIHQLGIQLRIQSKLMSLGPMTSGLHPSYLQLTVPHDPRIDLIPNPMMRDRMIIYRDLIDYDRCFALLLNGSLFHGGDPTNPMNWELPLDFVNEFWFMCSLYRSRNMHTFLTLQASSGVDHERRFGLRLEYGNKNDGNDLLDEFLDMQSQQMELRSNDPDRPRLPQYLYESFRSPPSLRNPVENATLDDMMELFNLSQVLKL
ncbi:hypothetical protein O0I10_004460 [Lichtheimia ornata]|uniref:BZIP domain-containing protein n=1 Tax=Lichtheimia ornata TaxID=688661 RepID=A0AAD7V8H5_9FUNG|nr:uncharacterized protein O0I10_004460 [Lichtheimia ornata]KAJ8659867.1 hypothetical protein O0I10_004460 [Lichtheimia ornata]